MNLSNGHISKEERQRRLQIETTLKGSADKISKPPRYLTSTQKKIYKNIIQELEASNILSNLDVYILVSLCRAIDRVNYIEKLIDNDIDFLHDTQILKYKQHRQLKEIILEILIFNIIKILGIIEVSSIIPKYLEN